MTKRRASEREPMPYQCILLRGPVGGAKVSRGDLCCYEGLQFDSEKIDIKLISSPQKAVTNQETL